MGLQSGLSSLILTDWVYSTRAVTSGGLINPRGIHVTLVVA